MPECYASRAFVYYGPKDVRTETLEFSCGQDEMIVRINLCARCGTDRTVYRVGHPTVDANAPIVLGHEIVAEIVEVGAGVSELRGGLGYWQDRDLSKENLNFKPGQRVIFQSRAARYRDGYMLMGDPVDILSFRIHGGYSQYMKVTPNLIRTGSVIPLRDSIPDEAAVLVEPAACALESIYATPHPTGVDGDGRHIYSAGIRPGGTCCIIGSGAVSLIYARLAQLEGAARVVVLVRSEEKVLLTRRLLGESVEPVIIPGTDDLDLEAKLAAEAEIVEQLRDMTDGRLFDDVVTACADPAMQRLMLQLYTPEGYGVGACFGGTHATVDHTEIDLNHYRIAKTVGTSGCSTRTMETIARMCSEGILELNGYLDPNHHTLDDPPETFFLASGGGLRPVLAPWE